jgi:hypothetical protein
MRRYQLGCSVEYLDKGSALQASSNISRRPKARHSGERLPATEQWPINQAKEGKVCHEVMSIIAESIRNSFENNDCGDP